MITPQTPQTAQTAQTPQTPHLTKTPHLTNLAYLNISVPPAGVFILLRPPGILEKQPENLIKQYIRPPKKLARVGNIFCPQPKPPRPPILTFLSPKCIISLHIGERNAISDTKLGKAIGVSGDGSFKPRLF